MNKVVLGALTPKTEEKQPEVEVEVAVEPVGEIYVLPGVANFKCGKFQFTDEMLILTDAEEIEEFQVWLRASAATDQYARRIRKVNAQNDDNLTLMKSKLISAAVNGVETSDSRPNQMHPAV